MKAAWRCSGRFRVLASAFGPGEVWARSQDKTHPCGAPNVRGDSALESEPGLVPVPVRDSLTPGLPVLQDSDGDSHRISPSPVVHVRGLCEAVVEADLIDALEKFGSIW